jgi:hypothetical protein
MQELPQAAGGARFFEARRWRSLVTHSFALTFSSAAFAQLNTPPLFTSIPQRVRLRSPLQLLDHDH